MTGVQKYDGRRSKYPVKQAKSKDLVRVVNNICKKYCNIQYQYQAKKSIANTNTNNSVKKYCNNEYQYF